PHPARGDPPPRPAGRPRDVPPGTARHLLRGPAPAPGCGRLAASGNDAAQRLGLRAGSLLDTAGLLPVARLRRRRPGQPSRAGPRLGAQRTFAPRLHEERHGPGRGRHPLPAGRGPDAGRCRRQPDPDDALQPWSLPAAAAQRRRRIVSLILEALKKLEREKQTPERGFLVVGMAPWSSREGRGMRTLLVLLLVVAMAGVYAWVAHAPVQPQREAASATEAPAAAAAPVTVPPPAAVTPPPVAASPSFP